MEEAGARSPCRMKGRPGAFYPPPPLVYSGGKAWQASWRNQGLSRSFSVSLSLSLFPSFISRLPPSLSIARGVALFLVILLSLGSRRKVFQGVEIHRPPAPRQLRKEGEKRRPTDRTTAVGKDSDEAKFVKAVLEVER